MEKKINVAELLKSCPKGMELDCTMFIHSVTFNKVVDDEEFPITIETVKGDFVTLTKYGTYAETEEAKCVIFPKGKTTWEGFVPTYEFKDGDVLVHTQNESFVMSIYHKRITEITIKAHCILWDKIERISINKEICCYFDSVRFATEEEKAKLFKAIKDNGYEWNEETKTLEKLIEPKFKVGDRIKAKELNLGINTITKVCEDHYKLDNGCTVKLDYQEKWELVPDKFDITTLVSFESKVLVRDSNREKWKSNFWGFYDIDNAMNYPYECCGASFAQCIPYEGNEHLLGATNDCDEYYKNW